MGTKERKAREKEDLKRKILDAAQEIINREGFAALSMRKLADRIEYSAASIYLYFRNREQIAQELGEAGYEQLFAMMSAAAVRESDILKRIKAVALAYVSFGLQHPETYRLIFMADSEYMTAVFAEQSAESAANKAYQLLIDLAEDLQRQKFYRGKAASREIAEMIWAALHGIVSLKLTCAGFQLSENLVDVTTSTLISGLTKEQWSRKRAV